MSDISVPNDVLSLAEPIESLKQVLDTGQFRSELGKREQLEKKRNDEAKKRQKNEIAEHHRVETVRRDKHQFLRTIEGRNAKLKSDIDDAQYANFPLLKNMEEREHQGQKKEQEESDERSEISDPEALFEAEGFAEQIAGIAREESIFEIVLPDGSTVGVVAKLHPRHVDYVLDPSNGSLGKKLRQRPIQMELKGHLEQRIGKQVNLSVT